MVSGRTAADGSTAGRGRGFRPALPAAMLAVAALALLGDLLGCGKGASPGVADADGGRDASAETGPSACPASDAGTPAGVADDFGPNARGRC